MKIWPVVAVLLFVVGCTDAERSPIVRSDGGADASLCTDQDGDGYGDGCAYGDCNDEDPSIHKGCRSCVRPAEGCSCDSTSKPVSCYLDPSFDNSGDVMCHEGTRYCRNGSWSGCESIFSYPKPSETSAQAVVVTDAGVEKCSDCRPNCFVIRDNLNPVDGGVGSSGNNTTIGDGGSLGLGTYVPDAAVTDAGATWDAATCIVGSAPDKDCDGIFDLYDPYPTDKPFGTSNPAIYMDLDPGATGTGSIDLKFNLKSIDVYFMVDQTSTMEGERDNLVATLTKTPTGATYVDPGFNCADYDNDGKPNNELKSMGITGAIRCSMSGANFGAGFFRELPFSAYSNAGETAFRNLQDITSNVNDVLTAVNKLTVNGNKDYDEDTIPALHSLITGDGMFFGTDLMSLPTRTGCPASTWGYPCFRNDAIPIVLLFTDASPHNGRKADATYTTLQERAYNTLSITNKTNSDAKITMVSGNESFTTGVIDAGDLTNRYVSFQGDTTKMVANNSADFTCDTTSSPDAFYKFSLSSSKSVTLTTANSDFGTALGVWRNLPTNPTATATNPSGNDAAGSAFSFGDVANKYLEASGSTNGLSSDYMAADLGCSSYAGSNDATFTFSISQPSTIALDTAGSSIGTSLSLWSSPPVTAPAVTAITSTNDKLVGTAGNPGPYDVGAINNAYNAYSGTTSNGSNIASDYSASQLGCSPYDSSPDATYQFTVSGSSPRRVRISSEGSAIKTVLSLMNGTGSLLTTGGTYTTNETTSNPVVLGALDDKAFRLTGDTNNMVNDYDASVVGCSASSRDAVYQFTLNSARTVQIDTNNAGTQFDTVLSLFKGASTTLTATNLVTCNDDASGSTATSSITQSLVAGTYWIVVKGAASGTRRGPYVLNVRDTSANLLTSVGCDYNSGSQGSSLIETDLSPGTYKVVVKGKTSTDTGAYKIQFRDVTGGTGRVACNYNSGLGGKSYLEAALNPGTYTVVLKGDSASSGAYKLSVRDADRLGRMSSTYCETDGSITQTLAAGDYYVGVKGQTATDLGQYQVHFGGGALTTSTFYPKKYTDVVAAMKARSAYVIPILSCGNDPNSSVQGDCNHARAQFKALAKETGSMIGADKPAVFDINSDGSGMSKVVVDAVKALAGYLVMDVAVRVSFAPDANPGFTFTIKAVPSTNNGCLPAVDNEFQDCMPGASPKFEVSFTNPLDAPVPLNPADPKGGYNFRAELIGDDQFIVDSVPIYIVPKAVVNVPVPVVHPTGTYSQNLAATGCSDRNDLPDWNELTWNATIPTGTSVSFAACGGASSTDLTACTPVPLCTITGGATCNATKPCPSDSVCSAGGTCWKITGNTCTDSSQCKAGATCKTGMCVYANQPIDVGDLLGTHNHQPNLRVQIGLTANTTANVGPTVHDWQLNYLCKSTL